MRSVVFRCALAAALLATAAWMQAQTTPLPPGTSVPVANAPGTAATFLAGAENAIARQDWSGAESLLTKALAAEPSDALDRARIFYDRGYVEQAQHQIAAADADYRNAESIDPKQFESYAALGRLLAQQQQWKQARQQLEAAAKLQPASGDAREAIAGVARTLAHVDGELHDDAAASDALLAALKLTPEQTDDTYFAAQLAEDTGEFGGAEKEYRKVLAEDPTSIPATEGLARALNHQRKFAEAESALGPALAREPNDPTLLALSVTALAGEGKTQSAVLQLETLHLQNPNQPAITRMLADLYSSAGQPEKAAPLYRELLANDKNNPDLLTAAGENLMHRKQWAQAVETFEKSLRIQPAQEDAWSGLAFAAWKSGQYALTLTALDRRAQTVGESPATLFMRATSLDHLHRTKLAIQCYRKFLSVATDQYADEAQQTRQRLKALEK